MSAVLDAGVDLSWVTFEETREEKVCDATFHGEECPNVAVYLASWGPDTDVPADQQDHCNKTTLICLRCFEGFTQPHELVACARCVDQTGALRFKRIIRTEPLR